MLPKCPKQKLKVSLKKKTKRSHIKPTKVDVLIWLGYISMMQKLSTAAQLQAREEKQNSLNSYHIRTVANVGYTTISLQPSTNCEEIQECLSKTYWSRLKIKTGHPLQCILDIPPASTCFSG